MMMRKMSRALKPATSTLEALHPFSQPRRWGTGANTCPRPPPLMQRLRLCKHCMRPGLSPRWVDDDDDDDEGVGFQKRVGGCPSVISVLCLEEDAECVRSWAGGDPRGPGAHPHTLALSDPMVPSRNSSSA